MEEITITCPYCWQQVTVLVDAGAMGRANIVDDCEVCCRPIEISYRADEGDIVDFDYHAMEGNES
jgi:hypothetical protein